MSGPFLRRFALTVLRDKSTNDKTQMAFASATLDLYRQGATVNASSPITIANGTYQDVDVYDLGSIKIGDDVYVGVGGPALRVYAIPGALTVNLLNLSGSTVTVNPSVRLMPNSLRPVAYADPRGTEYIGSTLTADSEGRIGVYVNGTPFDYVIHPSPVSFDSTSSSTLTGSTATLSWSHTVGGADRLILVAVAWQEATASETLNSVTYGGVSMSHVGTSAVGGVQVDLYSLTNPPTGTQNIVATWSGTHAKGAVGGAVAVVDSDLASPLGSLVAASNSPGNTSPTATVATQSTYGFLLGVVGIDSVSSTTTLTAGQTSRWSGTGGTGAALTRTQSGGETAASTGGSVAMVWTLGAAKQWAVLAVEAQPVVARLVIDAEGTSFAHSPYSVNATDFVSQQAAVDSLGSSGGTVFIPAGTYNATSVPSYTMPLTLPDQLAPINLIGAGADVTILEANGASLDMLVVHSSLSNISGLTLDGASQTGTGRGIVVGPTSVRAMRGPSIVDCSIRNTASWGLFITDGEENGPLTLFGDYTRVRIDGPRADGGIYVGAHNTTQYFHDCGAFEYFGIGAKVSDALGSVFESCCFENALNSGDNKPYMLLLHAHATRIKDCWFEHHREAFNTVFIEMGDEDSGHAYHFCGNVAIEDCTFLQKEATNPSIVKVHDASHEIHIRNPRITMPNVTADPTGGVSVGNACTVSLIGGEIATGNNYYDVGWSEGANTKTYLQSRRRFRIPSLDATEEAKLHQIAAGDFIFGSSISQLKLYSGTAWTGIGSFYKSDEFAQTGSIPSTVLVDNPPAAAYRITFVLLTTAVDATATVQVTISWYDGTGSYSHAFAARSLIALGSQSDEWVIFAQAGSSAVPVSFTATKTGSGGTYTLLMRAEQF